MNWLSNFLVSLALLPLVNAVGQTVTLWGFAVLCLLGFVLVAKWVPETRERDADEGGRDLRRRWRVSEG